MTRLRIKICGLTREADVEAVAALDIDAVGFVLWPGSPRAVTPATATRVMRSLSLGRMRAQDPIDQITSRELEVLRLAAAGESNPQIAIKLLISVNTVKAHVKSILEKLNLDNRTQLAAYAMRRGLTAPEDEAEDRPPG